MNLNYKYDVVLPVGYKDLSVALSGIKRINMYIQPQKIIFITKSDGLGSQDENKNIIFADEDKIYKDMTFARIKELLYLEGGEKAALRTGWYFQQFIKMAYAFQCKNDYYLIWDADTIPLRHIDFFADDGKPYMTVKKEGVPITYNESLDILVNAKPKKEGCYIAEQMLINTNIMKKLITSIEKRRDLKGTMFYEKIIKLIPKELLGESGFSEYETYGMFVEKKYADLYRIRFMNSIGNGIYYFGRNPEDEILDWAGKAIDYVSFETWGVPGWNYRFNKKAWFRKCISIRTVLQIDRLANWYRGKYNGLKNRLGIGSEKEKRI